MGDNATFSNINKDRYIKTNGTGALKRKVSNSFVIFPVGKIHFNPARLKNDGTVDIFSVRVQDQFLQNGTSGNAITTNVVPKTWYIEEAVTGGSDVTMRLMWRPSHIGSGFDPNASQITHYTGGVWKDEGTANAAVADGSFNSDHKYREASNITSFSPFGVKSGAALPVELLYFYAEKESNHVRLDWQTVTEINNSHFDVKWSVNGIDFEKIGHVEGAGTTTDVQFYDFIHTSPAPSLNYYRLRQVDLDEKFEYTNIIQVTLDNKPKTSIKIFPNPATDYIVIDGMAVSEIVQILNINGQLVKEFQIQGISNQYSVSSLITGTYFIKVGREIKKIIIQK